MVQTSSAPSRQLPWCIGRDCWPKGEQKAKKPPCVECQCSDLCSPQILFPATKQSLILLSALQDFSGWSINKIPDRIQASEVKSVLSLLTYMLLVYTAFICFHWVSTQTVVRICPDLHQNIWSGEVLGPCRAHYRSSNFKCQHRDLLGRCHDAFYAQLCTFYAQLLCPSL